MVKRGIVSSSHELASFWGAQCLRAGGNVVDAAIVTSAVLSVVQNNMCGLGGDMFTLVKMNGQVTELNSSGRAADSATIEFYEQQNHSHIPARGPLAAVTVPGMVRGWGKLHSRFGSMEFPKLLEPAITYAEGGFPITEKYAGSIRDSVSTLGEFKEWREIFLPGTAIPNVGHNLIQRDLARSLRAIASFGPDELYEGDLARLLTSGIEEQGGLITENDLKHHESDWVERPLSIDYRGIKIYETSPNSQAATVLLWLNMLERFDLRGMKLNSEQFREVMFDTCVRAYAERGKSIGDPKFLQLFPKFTSKEFASEVLEISPPNAKADHGYQSIDGDTTYFAVGDKDGNCVSVIQSNYMGFGSGLVPRGTGIVLHNRGCYFSLDRNHHNALAPRKRTFHTLCASLGEKDGETLFVLGSMGGDVQPQIHVQLMTQILDFGVDLQRAIDEPRWIIPMTIYEKPSKIWSERKASGNWNGLDIASLGGPSSLCGHAQAIYRTTEGLFGAADPRGDGASVGF
jgi:gamma-glutamyltranspeptidase